MTLLWLLIRRDLRQAWTSAGLWLPVAFLLLVASLYPFAVGPDAALLARTGGGMIWIAALRASLLPGERLIVVITGGYAGDRLHILRNRQAPFAE